MIHKKGRALKRSDDNGKSKKKSRVVVEVRFHKLALIIRKHTLSLRFRCFLTYVYVFQVEQEDGDTRRSLKSLKI